MCEKLNTVDCLVPISHDLAYDGRFRWDTIAIDSCLAPMVNALNRAGIFTASCCCGHGEVAGHIWLHDGRILVILPAVSFDNDEAKDRLVEYLKHGLEICENPEKK